MLSSKHALELPAVTSPHMVPQEKHGVATDQYGNGVYKSMDDLMREVLGSFVSTTSMRMP